LTNPYLHSRVTLAHTMFSGSSRLGPRQHGSGPPLNARQMPKACKRIIHSLKGGLCERHTKVKKHLTLSCSYVTSLDLFCVNLIDASSGTIKV